MRDEAPKSIDAYALSRFFEFVALFDPTVFKDASQLLAAGPYKECLLLLAQGPSAVADDSVEEHRTVQAETSVEVQPSSIAVESHQPSTSEKARKSLSRDEQLLFGDDYEKRTGERAYDAEEFRQYLQVSGKFPDRLALLNFAREYGAPPDFYCRKDGRDKVISKLVNLFKRDILFYSRIQSRLRAENGQMANWLRLIKESR